MRHFITIAIVVSLSSIVAIAASEQEPPLPEAKEVKSMSIRFYHRKQREHVKFASTAEDWAAIRVAMLPAKKDSNPAKWVSLGSLRIEKTDGHSFVVELYATSEDLGAFAAGRTFEERVYFRGGKSDDLVKALHAAYERSRNENK